jgi:DNA-binding XRE family transcriptional regulator
MRIGVGRIACRESQEELSTRAKASRVTVRSVERAPHPALVLALHRLAAALGIEIEDLPR